MPPKNSKEHLRRQNAIPPVATVVAAGGSSSGGGANVRELQHVLERACPRSCRFRTGYRIATNHVLNMKRREGEMESQSFASYGDAINGVPDLDLPDPKAVPVDVPLLVEEAKVSCTMSMLLCLDRKQRLIFVLAELFGVSDTVGSEILEMSPDNFRQSLSRARRDLYHFMNNQCGLINANNPCRCHKKTKGFKQTVPS